MNILVENLGKKFTNEWIFRNLSFSLTSGENLAVIGQNGSGKSTLLKVLAGFTPLTQGKMQFSGQKSITSDSLFKHLSWAAPYLQLIEELTLEEQIDFHEKFKKLSISKQQLIDCLDFSKSSTRKMIKFFSSGMKQKLKLALAIYSQTSLLLLDEPTSNLDSKNIAWYLETIEKNKEKRTIIVASNQTYEYDFCQKQINIHDWK
ncbi:MAG: ABC transporter ATP-binding protein [Bacteroidetes bacterium]|nr:MAG: ABC transporter ATP-binding protein [Bacteroidota bacterium]